MIQVLENLFRLTENQTTIKREIIGGITTFSTMSYIIFVQPSILSLAGMDFGSVLLATCISSAIATFLMAILSNYPFALAPGMGENFLFTFTICLTMGFSWQSALTIVFISGLLFVALSLFRFREKIIEIFPDCLKNAIPGAIGLLIAFVGLQWAGLIILNEGTMVSIGSFKHPIPGIALISVALIVFLQGMRISSAILIGLFFSTICYLVLGIIPWKPPELHYSFSTFFQLNFAELIERWPDAIVAIFVFFFLDLFDTVGTLIGVGNTAGFMREGKLPRASGAFLADALGTCVGALCGTSTVTSYIESAAGVVAGARTGLASVVTGICFLLVIPFIPFIVVLGYNVAPVYYSEIGMGVGKVSMYPAVAPALILVGFLMMSSIKRIVWEDMSEGIPAFLTILFMAFGYGITEGISAGCISFVVVKILLRRYKDINPWMLFIAVAFLFRYIFLK
ncbi:MAG: NCS2 family permease [Candidatus Hydrogenedentes bacterium]|nr:NCS2 family permease [Candidatus Hydrogenedentota bacterium]